MTAEGLCDTNHCVEGVCQNGGTCMDKVNTYECKCVSGFVGVHCEKGKKQFTKFVFENSIADYIMHTAFFFFHFEKNAKKGKKWIKQFHKQKIEFSKNFHKNNTC